MSHTTRSMTPGRFAGKRKMRKSNVASFAEYGGFRVRFDIRELSGLTTINLKTRISQTNIQEGQTTHGLLVSYSTLMHPQNLQLHERWFPWIRNQSDARCPGHTRTETRNRNKSHGRFQRASYRLSSAGGSGSAGAKRAGLAHLFQAHRRGRHRRCTSQERKR